MITRRAFLLSSSAAIALLRASAPAWAQVPNTIKVSFVLVNDIYQMSAQAMPDGKSRGGFAKLAAVVKAERAKGGHVVVAHGGDTLSPSLMSSLDHGAHIVALTNLVAPDIFAPGNHEFDFGKATFLQRMGEARFPLFAANLRAADGSPLPGFKDRAILTFDGVRVGLTGATFEDSARASNPEDLKFAPTVATMQEQAAALRREGADFVVTVMHAMRGDALLLQARRAADLILTGHTHDLFVNFDGVTAVVESNYDARYVTVIDVTLTVTEQAGRRQTTWWPQFRVIDTADVAPDPDVAAEVAKFEAELSRQMDVPIATTAVELDSRNATVRAGEAAIGNLIADAMRVTADADAAVMNGGGIRAGRVYPAGTTLTRRDVLAELPFGNRVVTVDISGAGLQQGLENGLRQMPTPGGRFPQVSGIKLEADLRRPAGNRITALQVAGAPVDPARMYKVATNDFIARGGDDYVTFRDAQQLLAPEDSPLLANEVMAYVQQVGTVRTGVEGRIVLR